VFNYRYGPKILASEWYSDYYHSRVSLLRLGQKHENVRKRHSVLNQKQREVYRKLFRWQHEWLRLIMDEGRRGVPRGVLKRTIS